MKRFGSMLVLVALAVAACAPAPPPGGQTGQTQPGAPSGPKSLIMANNEDPRNFWDGVNGGGGSGSREIGHLVNKYLANLLPDGQPVARLLAELPSVDKGTWNVAP